MKLILIHKKLKKYHFLIRANLLVQILFVQEVKEDLEFQF